MSQENQYLELLIKLLDAPVKTDRTGTGTHSVFGHQMRFNLQEGFPLLTTKKVHFKSIVAELLWFIAGSTNNNDLRKLGCTIWDEWAEEDGSLGHIYGHQWRNFGSDHYSKGFDQISWVINEIKTNPDSRRLIVSSWNPQDHCVNGKAALAPCHTLFQFYVQDSKLSCQLYQRSADTFLGVPFNIASYALLTHLIANECGLDVGEFIWTGGDVHLYTNHVDQAKEQLSRTTYPFPSLVLNTQGKSIYELNPEDISVGNYQHHPAIKAPVAV